MKAVAASNKQLAAAYGINYRAWLRWIKPLREDVKYKLGKKIGGVWNPKQVKIFFNHFDEPKFEIA